MTTSGARSLDETHLPPWRGSTIVLARLRDDADTRAYAARRRSEGKSVRDIRRCLKRAVARQLFKLLERRDPARVQMGSAS